MWLTTAEVGLIQGYFVSAFTSDCIVLEIDSNLVPDASSDVERAIRDEVEFHVGERLTHLLKLQLDSAEVW